MATKNKILFVDDDTEILALLKAKLSPMQYEWDIHLAEGGRPAIALLQRSTFDVIVSDLLMPGIDGISLLNAVMKKYPSTIRIVLSGASDEEIKLKSVNQSHQFLAKPIEIVELKSTILRALTLRGQLTNKTLTDLVGKISSLPRLSSLYLELIKEVQSPDSKLSTIGAIISKDVGMTAKILQLVNSSYFGIRTRVSSTQHAARLLGVETIKILVLTHDVFSKYEHINLGSFSLSTLMEHSQKVGLFARLITKNENSEESLVNDALVSGMLHDVGKIVLAKNFPKQYSKIQESAKHYTTPLWQIEEETFGASHAEVGAYLLSLWRLPSPVIEAVAYHHQPTRCSHQMFSPLTSVHVANVLEHKGLKQQTGINKHKARKIDDEYLNALGLTENLESWREICIKAEQDENKRNSI